MKILNIDAFAKVERTLTFGGKSYPVQEPTVQQFIDNLKAAEDLEKEGKTETASQSLASALKSIKESIPDLDEAAIHKLTIPMMTAVLEFIRGDLDTPAEASEAGADDKDAEAKKPS